VPSFLTSIDARSGRVSAEYEKTLRDRCGREGFVHCGLVGAKGFEPSTS
jgi:hypothetical protein